MNIIYNNGHANRGMQLEEEINLTNKYYLDNNIAIIYKKPTPIKILQTTNDKTILKAVFDKKSTLDYNGVFKGKYLEFDAKETLSKTSFPISNIQKHQLEHMKRIIEHDGICFLIVRFVFFDKTYILLGTQLFDFLTKCDRKSIPLKYFEENCNLVPVGYMPRLNYLSILEKNKNIRK